MRERPGAGDWLVLCGAILYLLLYVAALVLIAWTGSCVMPTIWGLILLMRLAPALLPGSAAARFPSEFQFGPVRRAGERRRDWDVRLGLWWLSASIVAPLSWALVKLQMDYGIFGSWDQSVTPALIVAVPVLGIACFVKAAGAFFSAWRGRAADR